MLARLLRHTALLLLVALAMLLVRAASGLAQLGLLIAGERRAKPQSGMRA